MKASGSFFGCDMLGLRARKLMKNLLGYLEFAEGRRSQLMKDKFIFKALTLKKMNVTVRVV